MINTRSWPLTRRHEVPFGSIPHTLTVPPRMTPANARMIDQTSEP
jgi:hypothetical protein